MVIIGDVNIEFPYEPYEVQKELMKRVIHGIQNSQNAVLESPTGTGKTMSLLCSSLAVKQLQNKEVISVESSAQLCTRLQDNPKCIAGGRFSTRNKINECSSTHREVCAKGHFHIAYAFPTKAVNS